MLTSSSEECKTSDNLMVSLIPISQKNNETLSSSFFPSHKTFVILALLYLSSYFAKQFKPILGWVIAIGFSSANLSIAS